MNRLVKVEDNVDDELVGPIDEVIEYLNKLKDRGVVELRKSYYYESSWITAYRNETEVEFEVRIQAETEKKQKEDTLKRTKNLKEYARLKKELGL